MSSFAVREAKLRQAIADASSLAEQRRLTTQLDALRREASDQLAIDRELELGAQIVRDTTTPVRVHDRHTAATDWLNDIEIPNGENYDKAMRVEAALWFKKLHTAVKSDRDEFAEQAQGMAQRLAGQYGPKAAEAAQAFLQEVARLFRQADDRASDQAPDYDQSGNAESEVTDYDPETDQGPMWGEDYDGEQDTGSQIGSEKPSEQPGATARRRYPKGSARGGGRTANFTHEERRWYNEGYDRGADDRQEFANLEGIDPDDFSLTSDDFAGSPLSGEWAGQSIPEIFGSWDNATPEAMDAYEEGYEDGFQGNTRQASKKIAQAGWRDEGDGGWTFSALGGEVAAAVFQGSALEGDTSWSFDAFTPGGGRQNGTGYPTADAAKQAAEAAMGMSVGGPTAKRKTAGVYCKTHQVWVGDENADTHSRDSCKKEQRATEKTKDARKQAADDEATNEFAEEVAEELAETSDDSEESDESGETEESEGPVDNEGDGDVSSEDASDDEDDDKTANFRRRVQAAMKKRANYSKGFADGYKSGPKSLEDPTETTVFDDAAQQADPAYGDGWNDGYDARRDEVEAERANEHQQWYDSLSWQEKQEWSLITQNID